MDRSALKKDCGAAIAEWAVDHIGVPRDPADVCHAAKDVPVLVVEHVLQKRGETVRGTAWPALPAGGTTGSSVPSLSPNVIASFHLLTTPAGTPSSCREFFKTLSEKNKMSGAL